MDALTVIVGVFLFHILGFLQVPGTLNGDSSTFFCPLSQGVGSLNDHHRVLAGNSLFSGLAH